MLAYNELGLFVGMCAACLLFWVGYHQTGTTLTYFARDQVDRTLGGRLHPGLAPSAFLSLPGLLFLVLSPFLLLVFGLLRQVRIEPWLAPQSWPPCEARCARRFMKAAPTFLKDPADRLGKV